MRDEADLLAIGVDEREAPARLNERERQPGETAARPGVGDALPHKIRVDRETIEQVMRQHVLLALDRRPVLAGILFGILTIKPQLGLLLPLMLLLERRWLTIAVALATATCLVAVTAVVFGPDVWLAFWHKVVPQQQWLTAHGEGLLMVMVASVFYGARLVHLPEGFAWAMQGVVAALAVGAVVWAFWKRRDRALALSLLITATFLVTPYILNYDMVVLGFAVALLRERTDNTMADHWLLIAVWTLPVAMMLAAAAFIPLAPMVLVGFACRLIWRLAHAEAKVAKPASTEVAAIAA